MLLLIALVSFASLLVVWVAYPLMMGALAKRRHSTLAQPGATEPTVSIIIATRDYETAIRHRLDDCLSSYDPEKLDCVIAVDRLSTGTAEESGLVAAGRTMLANGRCTVVIGDEPGGKAATLNAAVRASRGEILVFTDTHQRFGADAVRHLIAALRDPRVGASSGCLELNCSDRQSLMHRYWNYERWLRECEARTHSPVGVTGAIWALRRSLWTPLPSDLILDDVYAPMKVVLRGYRVAFAERARALETRRPDAMQEYRRKVRTLTGVIQLCVWLPALLAPGRNPIWAQFVFHKLLRLLTPYWLLAILVWVASLAAPWAAAHPLELLALVTAGAIGAHYVGDAGGWRSRVRQGIASLLLLQAAVVVATVNGVRRRWDVWRPNEAADSIANAGELGPGAEARTRPPKYVERA